VAEISTLESKEMSDDLTYVELTKCLAALRLIQPFDWMQWPAPPLSELDLDQLDIHDCTRHVTRLVRADRFSENLLFGWIRSGHFRKLCETARRAAAGNRAPYLPKAA